ncbi:MAG TPA: hypothetical protein VLU38_07960 [Methanomassiliicoccales archaeon]|nr:hypothetical protein [Methanomassiliicoccales archaeon]
MIALLIELVLSSYYDIAYMLSWPTSGYSNEASYVLNVMNIMALPFFVTGMALLLVSYARMDRGAATWSRNLFLTGAFLFLLGGLISSINTWPFYSSYYPSTYYEDMFPMMVGAFLATTIGTILCILAMVSLVRCYLRGQISRKCVKQPNLDA